MHPVQQTDAPLGKVFTMTEKQSNLFVNPGDSRGGRVFVHLAQATDALYQGVLPAGGET